MTFEWSRFCRVTVGVGVCPFTKHKTHSHLLMTNDGDKTAILKITLSVYEACRFDTTATRTSAVIKTLGGVQQRQHFHRTALVLAVDPRVKVGDVTDVCQTELRWKPLVALRATVSRSKPGTGLGRDVGENREAVI